jgi:threonine dehydratase
MASRRSGRAPASFRRPLVLSTLDRTKLRFSHNRSDGVDQRSRRRSDRVSERARIRRTPVEFSPALSAWVGVPVWLKLEFLQLTGSFKLRGALFRLSKLSETERRLSFVTSSAGNHGKAVAYAAKQMGLHAVVCVPSTVDDAKYRGIVELGADVRRAPFPGYDATEDWAIEEAARQGLPFVSPTTTKALLLPGADRWPLRFSKTSPMRARS